MENPELHLFIIWEHARYKEKEILENIQQNFEIKEVYEIKWDEKLFSNNLSRFYGTKLPDNSFKEKHCGKGKFLLIIVLDRTPQYFKRSTSRGEELVNTKMFDSKELYRSWTGGGHKVHGTNSPHETNHDITLLLGIDSEEYLKYNYGKWEGDIKRIEKDIIGAKGWKNIGELFYTLNNTINYLVLRNFECLPDEYNMKDHGDIDLLTDDYSNLCWIVNSKSVFKTKNRVHHVVKINNQDVFFDYRYVGDKYYDEKWQEELLNTKELKKDIYYAPNDKEYFYSLLYHALIHKPYVSEDYLGRLYDLYLLNEGTPKMDYKEFSKVDSMYNLLNNFMFERGYSYTDPIDNSVFLNTKKVNIKISLRRRLTLTVINTPEPVKKLVRPIKRSIFFRRP
ncbi:MULTISPECIES: hypothetical protein [Shouchella]|uniref:hypothetical protein n=1 Tax=Shouchella TaxID=2893057 RepID=UPI000BA669A2|nr:MULTISPECIES: hypothetical protein [Shouchella]MCM3378794.1 hypothetical protein [Shouchella rhizosphaerae]PAD17291.1 hypothetical protein CHH73_09850 [Shouchella clausii]